jgi:hypothetical protein
LIHLKKFGTVVAASLLLLTMLSISACGGGEPTDTAADEQPAAVADAATVETDSQPAETEGQAETSADTSTSEIDPEAQAEEELISVPVQVAECESIEIPDDENIPVADATEWAIGPENAPLTLIEYGDFQ